MMCKGFDAVRRTALALAVLVLGACSSVVLDEATEARFDQAREAAPEFRHLDRKAPPGWRRLGEPEIAAFVAGRVFQSHYLHGGEVFEYTFSGSTVRRKTLRAMTYGDQTGTWTMENGMLCAQWNVRLCYHLFTNGDVVVARRTFGNRVYVEMLNPMMPAGPVPPLAQPQEARSTEHLRRCVERKPREYRLVFADFDARAVEIFGDDYMENGEITPKWVRDQMRTATLDALQAGRIERLTAQFIRDTLSNCFREAFAR